MNRRGSHIIIPVIPAPLPHVQQRLAEIRGEPSPLLAQRASYALTLIGLRERRFKEGGDVDEVLADRIERVLWTESTLGKSARND